MKHYSHIVILSFFLTACAVQSPPPSLSPDSSNNLTLGIVQSKIHKGMSQTDVLETLGSPNIVTKNSMTQEVWTYDKVGSNRTSSTTVNYGQRTLGQGFLSFLFGGTTSSSTANAKNETKTLTVIITFDDNKNVSNFTYQSLKY